MPNNILRKQIRGNIYNHELAYLSLASIIGKEWGGYTPDISYNDLVKVIKLYREYNIPFKHKDDLNLSDQELLSQFSVRVGLQQFIYQRHPFKSFYRYHYLFNYESPEINVKKFFLNCLVMSMKIICYSLGLYIIVPRNTGKLIKIILLEHLGKFSDFLKQK